MISPDQPRLIDYEHPVADNRYSSVNWTSPINGGFIRTSSIHGEFVQLHSKSASIQLLRVQSARQPM